MVKRSKDIVLDGAKYTKILMTVKSAEDLLNECTMKMTVLFEELQAIKDMISEEINSPE